MPRRLLAYYTPDSLSGLVAWLKADALANTDGDLIASWTDSSGNTNTPVQATGGLKPTFKVSQINGKPILRFNGSNRMAFPSESPFDIATPTIFVVFAVTGGSGGDVLAKNTTSFSDARRRKMQISTSLNNFVYGSGSDGQVVSVPAPVSGFNMFGIVTNSDSLHSLYLNGNQTNFTTTLGDSTLNAATIEIGAAFGNGAEGFTGDIAEIIIYNRPLNGTDVIGLQNYLTAKYNLSVTAALGGTARQAVSNRFSIPPVPCLRMNGTSDYVDLGTLGNFFSSFNAAGLCSFCFTMATRSTSQKAIFGSSNGATDSTLAINMNQDASGSAIANKMGIFMRNSSNVFQNVGTLNSFSLSDGKFHRYVVQRVSMYVWQVWQDGVALPMSNPAASGDFTSGFTNFSHSLGIGASNNGSWSSFSAMDIFNVEIYQRALTSIEIASDFAGSIATNPLRSFSLTAGSNTVAYDRSSNQVNGIISGARQLAPRQLAGGGATI